MALLRDENDFADAIANAARATGLNPVFIEKDYWVTQVLRALHAEFPGAFLMKGGTSLSKGVGLIERFSEDIDILVTPAARASVRDREGRLRTITVTVAERLGLEWRERRAPGRGRDAHRADEFIYAEQVGGAVLAAVQTGVVLLETGYAGGREPSAMIRITPLLCDALGLDPDEFDDTREFEIQALAPERTLVEKLFALHHLATVFDADEEPRAADEPGEVEEEEEPRLGRHYYDIHQLLGDSSTRQALARDREEFDRLVADVEALSRRHFGGTTLRPEGGFAASPAFSPERGSEVRRWLERHYDDARGLIPRDATFPRFGDVLRRVEQYRDLL
jgi:Nucleotidyl transferase AbiEii toxin, Type IV TA system